MSDEQEGGTSEGSGEDNVVRVDFAARHREREQEEAREESGITPELQELFESAPEDPAAVAKLAIFSQLIDRGMVMVALDPEREGVQVPLQFAGQEQLRLNFSHSFGVEDFDYDEQGVRSSLSFGGQNFFCVVPWSAVLSVYSHADQTMVVFEGEAP